MLAELSISRDFRRALAVVGLMLVVFAVRAAVAEPVIGVGFLYLLPTLLAALWFGRWVGVGVGVACTGLFFLATMIHPQQHALAAGLVRLVVFCAAGYAFAVLVARERVASRELALQEQELAELRGLRSALVPPQVPDRPAIDLATCFVPAEQHVAGDFFLVGEGPRGATVVVVGDVVGKGLGAARRAAFVRGTLAAYAPFDDDPCRLLELANRALIERTGASEDFVTAACVVYRPDERLLSWALAGHPPPMLLDEGKHLNGISPGLPLGLSDRVECARAKRRLGTGEGVLLFTDGLSEARRPFGDVIARGRPEARPRPELFGNDRIAAVLTDHRGHEAGEVVRALRAAAERFTGGGLADDLCMVAVRARE